MQSKVLHIRRQLIAFICIVSISLVSLLWLILANKRQHVNYADLIVNNFFIRFEISVNVDTESNLSNSNFNGSWFSTLPSIAISSLEAVDFSGVNLTLISSDHLKDLPAAEKFIMFGILQDDKVDHILESLTSDDVTVQIETRLHQVIVRCRGDVTVIISKIYRTEHYFFIEPIHLTTYHSPTRAFYKFETNCGKHIKKSRLTICQPKKLDKFLWHYNFSTFIPCNPALSKSFDLTHGKYATETKRRVTKKHFYGLLKLQNLFLKRRMPLMLWAGSALGWYRHCDTVPHSHDVDFAVPVDFFDDKIISDLACMNSLYLKHVVGHKNESMTMTVQYRRLPIDIMVIYKDGNMSYTNTMDFSTRTRYRAIFPKVTEICTTELRGYLFYVACNFQELIRVEYGSTFMSLVKHFHHIRKPKNLIQGENFTKVDFEKSKLSIVDLRKERDAFVITVIFFSKLQPCSIRND